MSWIELYSGKTFDYSKIEQAKYDIKDIAHALSMICRYVGHTKRFYSVAQHSLILSHIVDDVVNSKVPGFVYETERDYALPFQGETPSKILSDAQYFGEKEIAKLKLALLLHDASEAYLTDIPRPLKEMHSEFMSAYREMESKIQNGIYNSFGINDLVGIEKTLKVLDTSILLDEKEIVMCSSLKWDTQLTYRPLSEYTSTSRVKYLFETYLQKDFESVKNDFISRFYQLYYEYSCK